MLGGWFVPFQLQTVLLDQRLGLAPGRLTGGPVTTNVSGKSKTLADFGHNLELLGRHHLAPAADSKVGARSGAVMSPDSTPVSVGSHHQVLAQVFSARARVFAK